MSLMWKLLATLVLLNSVVFATDGKNVISFLEKQFGANPNLTKLHVELADSVALNEPNLNGWNGYIVTIKATVKKDNREVKQKMIWFSNGSVITQDLISMKTGKSLQEKITPSFKQKHYKKSNLIYGNTNAKHKIAIFSDPLCPFCRKYVPETIEYMKKYPNKFAIYYYHLPLASIHPAAVELTKAAIAAELKGFKNVVMQMYKVEVDSREKDVKKILAAFNKVMKSDIKQSDLKAKKVMDHFTYDMTLAEDLMVQGTPTIFFDGKQDKSKKKFKEVK